MGTQSHVEHGWMVLSVQFPQSRQPQVIHGGCCLFSSSKADNPKWYMVDVKYQAALARFVSLSELKGLHTEHAENGGPLSAMALLTSSRLSVQPVSQGWLIFFPLSAHLRTASITRLAHMFSTLCTSPYSWYHKVGLHVFHSLYSWYHMVGSYFFHSSYSRHHKVGSSVFHSLYSRYHKVY